MRNRRNLIEGSIPSWHSFYKTPRLWKKPIDTGFLNAPLCIKMSNIRIKTRSFSQKVETKVETKEEMEKTGRRARNARRPPTGDNIETGGESRHDRFSDAMVF